jgi:hypothetical protein
MGGRARRAGIEIETPSRGSSPTVVVIRLTGVVDASAVRCLREALSSLDARPIVIDVERCTLATREFSHLLTELRAREQPCVVACPRVGVRLRLGRRAEEPFDWIHGSVTDALTALAVPGTAPPPDDRPYVGRCSPVDSEPAYT